MGGKVGRRMGEGKGCYRHLIICSRLILNPLRVELGGGLGLRNNLELYAIHKSNKL